MRFLHPAALVAVFLVAPPFTAPQAHPGRVDRNGCHLEGSAQKRHCHGERATRAADSAPPQIHDEGVFDGAVLWVTDGDSLRVLAKGRDMEVRLADIDAPERDQPYGWEAKLALIDSVRGRHLLFRPSDVDQYGRVVARVWIGELDLNKELVRQGAAWFYPQYARDETLYYEEQRAREAKRGLWSLPLAKRVEPWEWRRRARQDARKPQ